MNAQILGKVDDRAGEKMCKIPPLQIMYEKVRTLLLLHVSTKHSVGAAMVSRIFLAHSEVLYFIKCNVCVCVCVYWIFTFGGESKKRV